MVDVENFLDKLSEKSWRLTVEDQIANKFDKILEALQENKEAIIEEVSKDLERIESVKNEDKEYFTASEAEKWIIYYIKESIKGLL